MVAAALTGACFGFLWWNASPAAIFMGDTGSLSLGGALAGLAILTRTELLLVMLGGLFVVETVSVMLQVALLQGRPRADRHGRRIFRIAPMHHHFEMLGWEQVTVTIRFWIITGLCVAAGLGVFYAEWVTRHRESDPATPRPARLLGGRAGGRRGLRGLRVRGRGQPHPPRRRRSPRSTRADGGGGGRAKAELLEVLGATDPARGRAPPTTLPDDVDLLVTSPGWRPTRRCWPRPAARGVPVWGEVELAWRLRDPDHDTPWLAVTGTNGKTTTVQMLDAILRAAGLRTVAAGNVGLPLVEAVMDPEPYDVLAVELSSFQLHYTDSMSAAGGRGAQRRRGPPRLVRLHGRLRRRQGPDLRARPAGLRLQRRRPGDRGSWSARPTSSRARGRSASRSACPRVGMVGVVEDILADRAFVERARDERRRALHAGRPGRARHRGPAPHTVQNALAAAALARAHGVSQAAVRDGLRGFRPDGHRIALVAEHDGVAWVDDSKATNPHAAHASLLAYDPVVWVAGGLAKGASFDDLVRAVARPAARRRAPGPGPGRDRGGAFATRAGCARHRGWDR